MKQSLQLRIGHQLSMTPQLQQAIKLLQLSSMDLQLEIQQALYSNPMLELAEELEHATEQAAEETAQKPSETQQTEEWNKEIPDELPVDARWDDVFGNAPSAGPRQSEGSAESRDLDEFHSVTASLQDHLLWQLNLTPMSDVDRLIATTIIDNVNDQGFLESPIEDLWQAIYSAPENSPQDNPIELEDALAVLHRVQQFDPPGVCATDLRECLLIQLGQLAPETVGLEDAIKLTRDYLPLVAERNIQTLSSKSGLTPEAIQQAIELIQTLSPRPGDSIVVSDNGYVTPDVVVKKISDRWVVTLNNELTPRLAINQTYANLVQRANNSAENKFMRNHLQEARWFLRSLESRNDTLLRVSRSIVEKQQAFLEQGPEAMKPMVLADIAELLGLHESTISRVTTQKYIDTPRGVYELKYFFSSHVSTDSGGECSSTAIRAMLKRMVDSEPPEKPYSDSKLAVMLQAEGIQVARRTVAKYRESLRIPASNDRKRFKQSA
ncbi:MAG TPA: RNA polymerase factor sigma-54 [Porticoccaceae bacterium]|nr:RNA polymerase factor sigma-54 [Porticoccaceae bacterium]